MAGREERIGTKRLVVGAHYGTRDFLVQRVTAVIMAVYTVVLLAGYLLSSGWGYDQWRNLFTFTCAGLPAGQVLATLAFLSVAYHAWVGVRDIWMDYVRPAGIRLTLEVLTVLWLVGAVIYFAQIIWSL